MADTQEFEALLKHPRPMGRPFMHRWVTIQARDLKAAKAAAATEARLCGWRVAKVRKSNPPSAREGTSCVDDLMSYVRIDLTEAGGTRSMIECDTERLRGLLESLTRARST